MSSHNQLGGGGIGRRARLSPGCLEDDVQWANGPHAGLVPYRYLQGCGGSNPSPPAF